MALPAGTFLTIRPPVKTFEELRDKPSKKARQLLHNLKIREPKVGDLCQVLATGKFYAFDGEVWFITEISFTSGFII